MKSIAVLVAGLLLNAVPNMAAAVEATAADYSCMDEKATPNTTAPAASKTPASKTAASMTDPEPGPVKGKVEDKISQTVRWRAKSVEERSAKEALSEARERVRSEPVEVEVDVPELPDRF